MTMSTLLRNGLLTLVVLTGFSAAVQSADEAELTVDRIFSSGDFQGESAPATRWLAGRTSLSLAPSKTQAGFSDLVRIDEQGQNEVLVAAEKLIPPNATKPLSIQGYELSKDLDVVLIFTNSARVWRQNTRGDYWTFRRSTGQLVKLGSDLPPSKLMFAKLSPTGERVGYVYENNLYTVPTAGGLATALTSDGNAEVINGTFDWVYEEEFDCRDGWRWSPDGTQIAYWQLDTKGVPKFTLIDNTAATYPVLTTFVYPKTGERNSACRVGVVPAMGGETNWIEIPGDTRTDYYIPRMEWIEKTGELAIQRINRLQNALEVMIADPAATETKLRTVLTERDGAWVDLAHDHLTWLSQGSAFLWISERDGWRQLYLAARDGSGLRRITQGNFDVLKVVHVDEPTGYVYFIASPHQPTQRYLYRTAFAGQGELERITPANSTGWHDYNMSPDGTAAWHTFSSLTTPPQVELVSIPDHQSLRSVITNEALKKQVDKLAGSPAELFQVDIGNGVMLDGWMMKPANFDPTKKYPLLFHVYGEPAGQLVVDRWGGKTTLWHRMLNQLGYVVAAVDNRGTPSPRGRDWRKSVYRKIGTLASEDQAAAARALLKQHPELDPARVGVWGWSGGGSMTLNLLFRYPDIYRTGISIAPVPDMRLYDTIYQERYMGLPQENGDDYRTGSPITHAAGLQGKLLIVHGTGDDNCHYQGVEKLADKLIELNKPFTLMAYPNRSHSISEGANTTRHLYTLMTRYLTENLAAGAK